MPPCDPKTDGPTSFTFNRNRSKHSINIEELSFIQRSSLQYDVEAAIVASDEFNKLSTTTKQFL